MALQEDRAVAPQPHGAWFENWTWFPQDASGDLKLTPVISRLCTCCVFACLVMAGACHALFEYSDVVLCARHQGDPAIANFLMFTAFLALGGLFNEICWAVAIRYMGLAQLYRTEVSLRKRLRVNAKMIWVFSMLTTLYHLMAYDVQYVHDGWLAKQHGGSQLVYSLRFLEWTVCAPVVLSVNGQLEHASDGKPRNGLIPSSLLTGAYCLLSWQGLVVTNKVAAWTLVSFAFLCYFLASVEELAFAWYIKDKGRAGPIRAGLLLYLVAMMGVYGAWYLLPIPGWMSTTLENKLYCLGDASFKIGTAIMVVVSDDVCATVEMRQRAEGFAEDLANLVDTASVPILGVSCEGLVDGLNKRASQLLQPMGADIVGLSVRDLVCEADREKCQGMIQSALALQETSTIEASMQLPGAGAAGATEQVPVLELSASGRKDKTGQVVGATLIGHDVSAHKQAEERKACFMAMMSHELRSPLHGIIGLTELLASKEEDEKRKSNLEAIVRCSKRMLGLVVDIMEMASMTVKGEGSKQANYVLHKGPTDLSKVIEEVLMLVERSSDKSGKPLVKPGVTLVNSFKPLPIIEADVAKCHQIFFNLITNACEFTAHGSITVSSLLVTGGQWVEVSVKDTGCGIRPQNLERIFLPFEQEDNSDSRRHGGIGLGLAIAHEVVRLHGGVMRVSSKLGAGTTFAVRLPVSGGRAAAAASASAATLSMESLPQLEPDNALDELEDPKCKPVVLSVDDDPVNQMILQDLLEAEFQVVLAMDGDEALEYLKKNTAPDLVLLDFMMPGASGKTLVKVIRQELGISQLDMPVLMISAACSSSVITEALQSGCSDCIPKPFDGPVLVARLQAALLLKAEYGRKMAAARHAAGSGSENEGLRIRRLAATSRHSVRVD